MDPKQHGYFRRVYTTEKEERLGEKQEPVQDFFTVYTRNIRERHR